jgi:nicotinamide-nucleotide amidase
MRDHMQEHPDPEAGAVAMCARLGERLVRLHRSLAVAESLTGGMLCSALARTSDAGSFFRGGIVAYASEVKYAVLGVSRGPVVSETAARQMAAAALRMFGADISVALTGAGGPDGQDGQPPGTVFVAVATRAGEQVQRHAFAGSPQQVCESARDTAVQALLTHVQ